ncbi:MAG: YIP1 family protein [Clostridia bacterium]|nr:YIP1 family protein [Clostridia bacterium]
MKKICKILALAFVLAMVFGTAAHAASAPYTTYTYDINENVLASPHAYVPDKEVTNFDMNMDTALNGPMDIFIDDDHNIYIADTGNARVVICNSEFVYQSEITTFVNSQGVNDALYDPQGLYVTDDEIYVCDTSKARIVVFTKSGEFVKIIYSPEADIMGTDTTFRPVSVAVDNAGRMYVVSSETYSGIFSYDENGNFESFIGAQKTSVNWIVKLRKLLFPNSVIGEDVTIGYLSCTVDSDGFVWATVDTTQDTNVFEDAIRAFNEDFAPIKRLNVSGADVMLRSGFAMPAGELSFMSSNYGGNGVSKLEDIALGPNGMWAVIDSVRSRVYVYDKNGVLLFAFGDFGTQLGNLKSATAITFYDSDIYILDKSMNSVTIYKRTEYGDLINQALYDDIRRNYEAAQYDWEQILKYNVNCDSAYVGVGTNLMRNGKYAESLEYFKAAYDTKDYYDAYKQVRKQWISKWIWIVPIIVVALAILLVKGLKYVAKRNKAGATKTGKRTFGEEIMFGFHVVTHPFDGFWDLKHEKRGSVRGGLFWLALATLTCVYQTVGASWMYNPTKDNANPFYLMATVLVPVILFIVGNWCLTTLFDGEGRFKDIFITTSYSLVPFVLLGIPSTLLTNILTSDEVAIVTLLQSLSLVWVGFLLFFGIMTTHGYSMGKNFLITLATFLAMLFIAFLAMLFSNLVTRMVGFVGEIITELSYRSY